VHLSYDSMASLIGPYGSDAALVVARDLDAEVESDEGDRALMKENTKGSDRRSGVAVGSFALATFRDLAASRNWISSCGSMMGRVVGSSYRAADSVRTVVTRLMLPCVALE